MDGMDGRATKPKKLESRPNKQIRQKRAKKLRATFFRAKEIVCSNVKYFDCTLQSSHRQMLHEVRVGHNIMVKSQRQRSTLITVCDEIVNKKGSGL
jgi:hypothetical protein